MLIFLSGVIFQSVKICTRDHFSLWKLSNDGEIETTGSMIILLKFIDVDILLQAVIINISRNDILKNWFMRLALWNFEHKRICIVQNEDW